jgi:hypothetical protein
LCLAVPANNFYKKYKKLSGMANNNNRSFWRRLLGWAAFIIVISLVIAALVALIVLTRAYLTEAINELAPVVKLNK